MWDTLWLDVHLATGDDRLITSGDGYGCIHDGAVGIHDGAICWVGSRADLPGIPDGLARKVEHGHGGWLTPGLIDAHTHVVFAGDRSQEFAERLNGASYEDIARKGGGILSTVKATRAASEQQLLQVSLKRVERMIQEGTTSLEIKSGYGLTLADEFKQLRVARAIGKTLPVRVHTTFLGAHAVPPEYSGRADDYVTFLADELLPRLHEENLVDSVDAFCETIAFSPTQTEFLFETARKLGLPVRIHSEQLSLSGGTALAARYGGLSADHLEYADENAVMSMAHHGTVAMLLPGAFYFIREKQLPPVDLLRKHNVSIGLATDCNPGTSPVLGLTSVMNMGCTLFRLTPEESFRAVTSVAARALGIEHETGMLREGLRADMTLWDVTGPHELSYWVGGIRPVRRIYGGLG
ncbi:imidazolonepropionase [Gluconacetobacter johannae DSM 13595]|uniref:Imidazolonepropionase n=1 Tax=Gluconacetobacter johannae TaxID=112140 RepID=A0A7W4J9X7_9PROT|nr:imidazolonepropionase [Gluconacetobacter johannae]MBB2177384.1 imidazolonepropionase [Gluconacetobacter johannae]GBQ81226.1 imidazolonepropionase [Gluconacetobacter johannae DSM 13595]